MKLYYVPAAPAAKRWVGTQADAKALDKEYGKQGYEQPEVPTDKPGLMTYLNALEFKYTSPPAGPVEGPISTHAAPDPLEAAELRAVAEAKATTMSKQLTSDSIVEFILNDATVAQVEVVFAALGTRFKETINGTR